MGGQALSLTTYSGLKGEIAAFLNRADLTDVIPTFIALAEADMNRRLRALPMVKRVTTTLAAAADRWSVPADWLEAINIQADGAPLLYTAPDGIDTVRESSELGAPLYYSIIGSEIEVAPTPSQAVTIEQIYYGRTSTLSDAAPSNWILANHPDAYLYGALQHAAPYLDEDPRVAVWSAGYERAISGINGWTKISRTSGGALVRRSKTFG